MRTAVVERSDIRFFCRCYSSGVFYKFPNPFCAQPHHLVCACNILRKCCETREIQNGKYSRAAKKRRKRRLFVFAAADLWKNEINVFFVERDLTFHFFVLFVAEKKEKRRQFM